MPIPKPLTFLWAATTVVLLLTGAPPDRTSASGQPAIGFPTCSISGTEGDDALVGTPGDDVICGLEGNDRIEAAAGNDVLIGGPGDDSLNGGDGDDVANYETTSQGITGDLLSGTASGEGSDVFAAVEGLTGSAGDDVLAGTPASNALSGLGGTDLLFGQGGADTVLGGDGEDYLTGAGGSFLDGGAGTNTCVSGPGPVAMLACLPPSPPDENDTHGFLDVKEVRSLLGSSEPVWRVLTISRWSIAKMWDRGFVVVYLDTFGAESPDYYAVIRSVGTRLRATLYRNGHRLARLRVWRRGPRSVSIRVPLRKLLVGTTRHFYRWRVVTLTDRCRRTCFDRIPNEGALVQPFLAAPRLVKTDHRTGVALPRFESPDETNEATITFDATAPDEGQADVNAKIFVGHYEARAVQIADTDPSNDPAPGPGDTILDNVVKFVPGTYEMLAQAPGHGHHRFMLTLGPGQTTALSLALRTNWASSTKGATASGAGSPLASLIDDTESTQWSHSTTAGSADGAQVTVALAAARQVGRVQVSAAGPSRFSALRQFEIHTCNASPANMNCTAPASFTNIFTSPADAFPGVRWRPVTPALALRSFDVPPTTATHVRIVMLKSQCSGGPQFSDAQNPDNDPLNTPDCVNGSTAEQTMRATELQVFGRCRSTTRQTTRPC